MSYELRIENLNISFEQEAYMNETNLEYLKERKMYSFLKYFK